MADQATLLQHGLTRDEHQSIQKILGRNPNLVELGIFSVMWSEHCSYKSSKIYLKKLPTRGRQVVCGPGENAGVVEIGDGLVVVFKMESHNHPSFIEPYQGAATGVGGILRDVFTMGARPVALLNSLCFGRPDHPKTAHLVDGVVGGIAGYGNCMGIPTVGGEVFFEDCYNGNILVNAMCVGIARKDSVFYAKAAGVGNPVIYVGAKTGRDGIHGATMASTIFGGNTAPSASGGCGPHPPEPLSLEPAKPDSRSPNLESELDSKRPTVQVGDPFTEKLLMEACLELMRGKDIVGIQDMGAAGLTCSSTEMAGKGRVGIDLDLSKVPLREEGMTPYEIMLSESQERMFLVGKKGSERRILRLFQKWDLDASVVGRVVREEKVFIRNNGELAGVIPTLPITEEAPVYRRPVKKPEHLKNRQFDFRKLKEGIHLPLLRLGFGEILKRLLASPNLASKRWVFRQYDHMVGTNTVVLPGSDAAVVRLKEPHTEGRVTRKGLAMTVDGNSRYGSLNPRRGAMIAVAEAARNIVCSGGGPLAVTDCLNFGSPENPEVMWQFREAVEGIRKACLFFKTPIVSGNVSFYNESKEGAIYPTPKIGMIGLLDDVDRHCTQWFQEEGDIVVLVGTSGHPTGLKDLGGSEYLKVIHGLVVGDAPRLDLRLEKKVQTVCLDGIRRGLVRSAHDCSEGGLAVTLAECCISGPKMLGAEILPHPGPLPQGEREDLVFLFAEIQSRIVVTVKKKDLPAFLKLARKCPARPIGTVGGTRLKIGSLVDSDVEELHRIWSYGFERGVLGEEGCAVKTGSEL